MSLDLYSFVVAHAAPGVNVSLSSIYPELKCWISERGAIERSGGSSGKVIKFNEKKYFQDISSGKYESIELFSERKWEKGEVSEVLNCDFSVVFSNDKGLMLSANGKELKFRELVDSFFAMDQVAATCDYAYGYVDSHAYGTGYARGIYMPDDNHPLMWSRRSEAGAWVKKQWADETDSLIRDVYPFNAYSHRKIEALPERGRQALAHAMQCFGECLVCKGAVVWFLEGDELDKARDYLKGFDLLASYV